MNPLLEKIAGRIIKEQELVIGPLAWGEARKVQGLEVVDPHKGIVTLNGPDHKEIIDRLVAQYERLFGRASHEVCKEAAAATTATMKLEEIPMSLR